VHQAGVQRREPTHSKLNALPESNEGQRANGDRSCPAQPVARRLSISPLVANISIVPRSGAHPKSECNPVRYLVGACEPSVEGQVPYTIVVPPSQDPVSPGAFLPADFSPTPKCPAIVRSRFRPKVGRRSMGIQSNFLGGSCDGAKKTNTRQKPRCQLRIQVRHVDLGPQPVVDRRNCERRGAPLVEIGLRATRISPRLRRPSVQCAGSYRHTRRRL
jgi:hypothetical protein